MASQAAAQLLPLILLLASPISAQRIGTLIPEVHPKLITQVCTVAGGCVSQTTALVTDALAHPIHAVGNPEVSCNTTPLNATLCPDVATCAQNCELEGVEYASLGILTSGSAVTLRQYLFNGTAHESVSPRVYLLAEDDMNYELLQLVNREFTFEVDISQLGCGMNGALYLSEMEASGNRSAMNAAGAQYGTGYCDAQCFTKPFINGLANIDGAGSCCNEMDIWEANSVATVYTPHTCSLPGSFLCQGDECTRAGLCDKPGCGINPYREGAQRFYGPGLRVDTTRPFTVVTQFVSADGTDAGPLSEIRRLYIQDGELIQNADVVLQATAAGAITQDYCTARNASDFLRLGGVAGMGESLRRGMVLAMSIWNSEGDFMQWLDAGENGPCSPTAGDPAKIVAENPEVSVTFSNVRWGEMGATFNLSALEVPPGVVVASTLSAGVRMSVSTWLAGVAMAAFWLL